MIRMSVPGNVYLARVHSKFKEINNVAMIIDCEPIKLQKGIIENIKKCGLFM